MSEKDPLADVRTRIDKIDTTIQQLVSERAECAAKVAEIKQMTLEEVETNIWMNFEKLF